MRLFIKGQEIATRSENLIEDQYITDDILNSVPIVLVTENTVPPEPEPEPEVEWSREISTDFFNAILKYRPNRNNLELTVLNYNEEEFAPSGYSVFDMHHCINIYKDTEQVGQMFTIPSSRTSSIQSYDGYSNLEQLKYDGEAPEFYGSIGGTNQGVYQGWINNGLITTEEEFNNLIIEDYSVDLVRTENTAITKQYRVLNNSYTLNFIDVEKIYLRTDPSKEFETRAGTVIWMVKNEGVENISLLDTSYYIEDTTQGYQSSIIRVSHKAGNPCILQDNFLYFVDVNGDLNDSTTVFSISTAYNLSDESCPFEVVITQDPEWIDRGTIKIKDDSTFKLSDTCNGLYASIIKSFVNPLENSTLEASFISGTSNYEYGKEFEPGEIICDHGYVQIWKDESLTFEECEEYANNVSVIYEAETIVDDFTLL